MLVISFSVCLTYFTKPNSLQVHLLSLLALSPSMLLQIANLCSYKVYNWVIFWCVYVYVCVYVCHIFIHSSVDAHWGWFHILATVYNAAINAGILGCIYLFKLMLSFSLDVYPRVKLLDHVVILYLVFWGTSILFYIVAAPVYITINRVQGSNFLYILTNICYLWAFWWQRFWQVIPCCGFEFHFSD